MNRDTNHIKLPKDIESMAENAEDLNAWTKIWHESDSENSDLDRGRLEEIEGRLMQHAKIDAKPQLSVVPDSSYRSRMPWLSMAAVFCIASIGAWLWFSTIEQRANKGETLLVELSDGSKVQLNSGSTIRYARFNNRKVYLAGEAFFDVSHNDKPFVLETFNSQIEVLGTRFNVRAWNRPQDQQTIVSLESGSIRLSQLNASEEGVLMSPGETRRVDSSGSKISESDSSSLDQALAWYSGDFVHRDQFIGVILDDLERRFDLELIYDRELRQEKMNIAIHQPKTVERILNDICGSLDLQYQAIQGGYQLRKIATTIPENARSSEIAP